MKDILWIALEIIVDIYQGFLSAYFVYKFLMPKPNANVKLYMILSGGTQTILLFIMNYLNDFEGISSILYWIGLFVFAVKMLKGNMVKKIFAPIVPLLTVFVITTLNLNLISSINQMSIAEIVNNRGVERIIVLISIQAMYYFAVRIILKLFRTDEEVFKASEWSVVIATAAASIVMAALLHTLAMGSSNDFEKLLINISILILLVMNIFVFHLTNSLIKKNRSLQEMEVLKLQEQYHKQYIDNATLQYDSMRKMRHDLKNQFSAVYGLVSENKNDEALEYIKRNTDIISESMQIVSTGNSIVNAIINSKLSVAASMGISVSCMSVNSFDGIDDIDLCNLLGNSLDNAITSCRDLPDEKFVSVNISKEGEIYTFSIQNSVRDSVLTNNPMLKTTKEENHEEHGFGTKILKDIADKYGGICDFYEYNNMFCCKIILRAENKDLK